MTTRRPKTPKLKRRRHPTAAAGQRSTAGDLRKQLDQRTRELAQTQKLLTEALQQQTTTADVLKVISNSTFDLQRVLDTLTESAARLCEAEMAGITRRKGAAFYYVTSYGFPAGYLEFARTIPLIAGRSSIVGRALVEKRTVHVADVLADSEFERFDAQKIAGFRTFLAVPMLREGNPIGVIALGRSEVRPFTDRQIALVTTFADQAVIAIENVRLFDEVQAKTEDLEESLKQQTATADVLKVISRSTFDLQTVLDTLVESATHLCEADHAVLFQRDGDLLRFKSSFGHRTEVHERLRDLFLSREMRLDRGSVSGRSALEARLVHVVDVLTDPDFTRSDAQKIGGFRAALGAPLLRNGMVVGVIFVAKTKPEPFSDKQIELVATFADQAVIAIENARLFDEVKARTEDLRQSLEYQTATSEVLRIISRSPTDVQPVFEAIASSALRLCGAKWSVVTRFDGTQLHLAALHNLSDPEGVDAIRKVFPRPLGQGGPTDRAILTGTVINLPDVLKDPEYIYQSISKAAGYRSHLAVPTIRDGKAVGAITVAGEYTAAFTERHVNLLKAFADQAVIAIENVRLFEDLQESLQQQIATANVLKTISRSAFDLEAVLNALIEAAARVCEADQGTIARHQNNSFDPRGILGLLKGIPRVGPRASCRTRLGHGPRTP